MNPRPRARVERGLLTALGGVRWQGGCVSMTTHMAARSAAMRILLRYRGRRFGSEKSMISANGTGSISKATEAGGKARGSIRVPERYTRQHDGVWGMKRGPEKDQDLAGLCCGRFRLTGSISSGAAAGCTLARSSFLHGGALRAALNRA
jgi:hypothetical protein